ncbi:MAG: hypothetical protein KatS3mg077_1860 [Candidatus Binatia bacterium]|nr:MAG: hypothetical protein KatS3mg077_1860 [Candidatus Binatia bacterium]
MAKRVGLVALSCAWMVAAAGVAWAQEAPSKPAGITRSFDRYEQEAAVSEGIWVEGAAGVAQDVVKDAVGNKTTASSDFGALRASYGMDMIEAGITFPFWQHNEVEVRQGGAVGSRGEEGPGDLSLFAKVLPLRTEWLDAGAGLQLSLPTGDEDKGLGIGEVGILPVGTVAAHLKPFDIRAHGGYRFVSDVTPTAREAIVYGGGIFYMWNEQLALRSEINGAIVDVPGQENLDLIFWQPGVDVRLPMDGYDILLRPTGTYGINDESPDWGFGGSITVWMRP